MMVEAHLKEENSLGFTRQTFEDKRCSKLDVQSSSCREPSRIVCRILTQALWKKIKVKDI